MTDLNVGESIVLSSSYKSNKKYSEDNSFIHIFQNNWIDMLQCEPQAFYKPELS